MKMQKSNIAYNLTTLRQLNKFSQEEVAERIGVSRQAVAKWEAGQSVPDILNCDALAKLYEHPGIALMKEDFFLGIAQLFKTALNMADTPDGKEKK